MNFLFRTGLSTAEGRTLTVFLARFAMAAPYEWPQPWLAVHSTMVWLDPLKKEKMVPAITSSALCSKPLPKKALGYG